MKPPSFSETYDLVAWAFDGRVDKVGKPCIDHGRRVASRVARMDGATDNDEWVALLHDVIEDTPLTYADLARRGYSAEVILDVAVLTRDRSKQTYDAYITGIIRSGRRSAMRVKLADVLDHLDPERPRPENFEGLEKRYRNARHRLQQALTCAAIKG